MASGVSRGHWRLHMSLTDCVGGMIRLWCVCECACVRVANVTLTRRDSSRSSEIITHTLDFKTERSSIPDCTHCQRQQDRKSIFNRCWIHITKTGYCLCVCVCFDETLQFLSFTTCYGWVTAINHRFNAIFMIK